MAGVVLVHGAWHGSWCWAPVVEDLEGRGVTVRAVDLPLAGFDADVAATREALDAMGPDTVLVGHSPFVAHAGALADVVASPLRWGSVRRTTAGTGAATGRSAGAGATCGSRGARSGTVGPACGPPSRSARSRAWT